MTLTPEDLATEQATRGPGRHRYGDDRPPYSSTIRGVIIGPGWPNEHWRKLPTTETPGYRGRHRAGLLGRLRRAVTR